MSAKNRPSFLLSQKWVFKCCKSKWKEKWIVQYFSFVVYSILMKYVGISRTFSEIWEVWRFAECVAKFCELFLKFPKPNKWFSIKSIISIASWMKVQGSSCSAGGDLEWDPRVERGERQSALRCRLLRGLERMTPATPYPQTLKNSGQKRREKHHVLHELISIELHSHKFFKAVCPREEWTVEVSLEVGWGGLWNILESIFDRNLANLLTLG